VPYNCALIAKYITDPNAKSNQKSTNAKNINLTKNAHAGVAKSIRNAANSLAMKVDRLSIHNFFKKKINYLFSGVPGTCSLQCLQREFLLEGLEIFF
tara:strand:+ start:311 stop:601 length:291 start_codon:yes stop_codon:yes gene_type:complete